MDPRPRRAGWKFGEPITIADNVWLGGGVIVCPGVSIGQNTVVGAGAVVTRGLPAGVVAAGVPARILREIDDRDRVEVPTSESDSEPDRRPGRRDRFGPPRPSEVDQRDSRW